MPAVLRIFFQVALYVILLFSCSKLGCLSCIEAHHYDIELIAYIKRDRIEALNQSVQYQVAKHWALVLDKSQDDRLFTEIILQLYRLACIVFEYEIEWHLLVQFLI